VKAHQPVVLGIAQIGNLPGGLGRVGIESRRVERLHGLEEQAAHLGHLLDHRHVVQPVALLDLLQGPGFLGGLVQQGVQFLVGFRFRQDDIDPVHWRPPGRLRYG
jgi:hypothetical protein